MRIPLKEGFLGIPPTFGEAIRDALSLSYQLMVSWQLTPFYSSSIQFIIAIDAGHFEIIADSIKNLLHPSLAGNLPIRLSHFA